MSQITPFNYNDHPVRVRHYIDDDGVAALATSQVRITAKGLDHLKAVLSFQAELEVA